MPAPSLADVSRTRKLQQRYLAGLECLLAVCWRSGREPLSGVRAYALKEEKVAELKSSAGRIDADRHDALDFVADVPTEEHVGLQRLSIKREGAWTATSKPLQPVPPSRPRVATSVGQAGLDLLRAVREWRAEGGSGVDVVLGRWLHTYQAPGGSKSVEHLHEVAKDAIKETEATRSN